MIAPLQPPAITEDPFAFRKTDIILWIAALALVLLTCLTALIGYPRLRLATTSESARMLAWPPMDIDLEPLAPEPLMRSAALSTAPTPPMAAAPHPSPPAEPRPPVTAPRQEPETPPDPTADLPETETPADTPPRAAPPKPDAPKPVQPPARTTATSPPKPTADRPRTGARQSSPGTPRGGSHTARESWESRIMVHLDNRKRYPDLAIARREQGDASVEFVVDRSGKVLSVRLISSTGYMLLDKEVHDLFKRAQPLPPPPPDVPGDQIKIKTGIRFYLE